MNAHEADARHRKADRIASVMHKLGRTADEVALLPRAGRRAAEELAGVRVASDETWRLVADKLAVLGSAVDVLPLPADPFEGLPGCEVAR